LYLSKRSVLFVEFGHPVVGDKELAAVGVGSTVGHGENSSTVVFDALDELVLKWFAVDTFALFARS
jgi:hypothetical protein